jgi:hypothetical protein
MAARRRWVLLAYRIPREPSTPRIAVWRRLRQLGAVQLVDGLVALPLDDRTREHFEWLAETIDEAGGEATIWIAEASTLKEEHELVARMRDLVAADYRRLVEAADVASGATAGKRRRALQRLRATLERVQARDYFPPPERRHAERAVAALSALVEAAR